MPVSELVVSDNRENGADSVMESDGCRDSCGRSLFFASPRTVSPTHMESRGFREKPGNAAYPRIPTNMQP